MQIQTQDTSTQNGYACQEANSQHDILFCFERLAKTEIYLLHVKMRTFKLSETFTESFFSSKNTGPGGAKGFGPFGSYQITRRDKHIRNSSICSGLKLFNSYLLFALPLLIIFCR